jgi:signal transduction histidine kinase
VRELLFNAVKHAQARHVKVTIRRDNHHIRINVEDDGVGFDTAKLGYYASGTSGFGLFSIRERLDYLGGRLELESEPGHGTQVSLVAPLRSDKEIK